MSKTKETTNPFLRSGEGCYLPPGSNRTVNLLKGKVAVIQDARVCHIATAPETIELKVDNKKIYIIALTDAAMEIETTE